MSNEVKVYVEAYGVLYEVINPVAEGDDGDTVRSSKWRSVGTERWNTNSGLFIGIIYEDFSDAFAGLFDTQGCDLPGCCGDPEQCDQQDTETCTCAAMGEGAACSDCPAEDEVTVPVVHTLFGGQTAEALDALLEIAQDAVVAPNSRIAAAATVLEAHFRVAGV